MKHLISLLLVLSSITLFGQQTGETKLILKQLETLPVGHFITNDGGDNIAKALNAAAIPYTPADGTFLVDDVKEGIDANRSAIAALQSGGSDGVVETIAFTGAGTTKTLTATRSVGGDLTADVDVSDDDADDTNEAQTISRTGDDLTLTQAGGAGGGTVSVQDDDADPDNEAQTISKSGTTVTLSDVGGEGGGSYTDEVNDADADASNEIQTATRTDNNVTISLGGGSFSVVPIYITETFTPSSGSTITLSQTPDNSQPFNLIMYRGPAHQTVAFSGSSADVTFSGATGNFNYRAFTGNETVTVHYVPQ